MKLQIPTIQMLDAYWRSKGRGIDILIASTRNTFLLWYLSERAEITPAPNIHPPTRRPPIMPGTRVESMPNYLWMHPIACTSCPGRGTGA